MKLVEQRIARRSDIRLLTAVNGALGIEAARKAQPTQILMDINLPHQRCQPDENQTGEIGLDHKHRNRGREHCHRRDAHYQARQPRTRLASHQFAIRRGVKNADQQKRCQ